MKKNLLLLLVLWQAFAFSQTTPAFKNIKITGNTTSDSALKVNVQESDGTINTISKVDLVDVLKYTTAAALPVTGVSGKFYYTTDDNKYYTWNGTIYKPNFTNLSTSQTTTSVTINPEIGTGATIPLGNGSNAGVSINNYTNSEKTAVANSASVSYVDGQLANKITKNGVITAATNTKITYDEKGLIISGTALTADDIPTLPQSTITNLATDLAGKVPASRSIFVSAPLTGGGDLGTNKTIAMPKATASVDGYLSATDWNSFNNKPNNNVVLQTTGAQTKTGGLAVIGTATDSDAITITNTDSFVGLRINSTGTKRGAVISSTGTGSALTLRNLTGSNSLEIRESTADVGTYIVTSDGKVISPGIIIPTTIASATSSYDLLTYNLTAGTSQYNLSRVPNTTFATPASVTAVSRPYKVWSGLVSQTGTSNPTATVLENTLGGTPSFARTSSGAYTITLTGAFTNNKTFIQWSNPYPTYQLYLTYVSANIINITTPSDGVLSATPIEIRVYN